MCIIECVVAITVRPPVREDRACVGLELRRQVQKILYLKLHGAVKSVQRGQSQLRSPTINNFLVSNNPFRAGVQHNFVGERKLLRKGARMHACCQQLR